jgi:hypothetical protein
MKTKKNEIKPLVCINLKNADLSATVLPPITAANLSGVDFRVLGKGVTR